MKISCTCKYCQHLNHDPVIEINFFESKIYYVCPECGKMNDINMSKEAIAPSPLPKSTTMRRRRR